MPPADRIWSSRRGRRATRWLCGAIWSAIALTGFGPVTVASAQAVDPGVRGGDPGAGGPISLITADETQFFSAGFTNFQVQELIANGLGPTFNLDSCAGCHAQPSVGGSSPSVNPQVAVATAFGANNIVPSFVRSDGPVVEARFKLTRSGKPDNGVHGLFVISGRVDSSGSAAKCSAVQENFDQQFADGNISLRTPTPLFGLGLVQAITDKTLNDNLSGLGTSIGGVSVAALKIRYGIGGSFNTNPNTGTITKFGWKAQNASLLLFAGEAYNVEMGITNELFPGTRTPNPSCVFDVTPEDTTLVDGFGTLPAPQTVSDLERFTFFMTFLAPPVPSTTTPGGAASIGNGRTQFDTIGCGLCHSPSITTDPASAFQATAGVAANLFSDLALHHMGPGLADGISQGLAAGDQFRTALLWGLGQRLFFLHDGRTNDLVAAIEDHASSASSAYPASEANAVVQNFNALSQSNQQDLLNFLRSL
jgi:CxxC motif-containing protein (DUF1111 family)